MKFLVFFVLGVFAVLMFYATTSLPDRGDPAAPANVYVSPDYIERSLEDTGTPNLVTAVLADYRGYDTLGETIVIVTAGLACIIILLKRKDYDTKT
ncbi:MAG: hypothetical protein HYX91_03600 [Chloroflexi bacterium]|nr:hypothetical protein [Chloroflexota bacterium]